MSFIMVTPPYYFDESNPDCMKCKNNGKWGEKIYYMCQKQRDEKLNKIKEKIKQKVILLRIK